MRANNGRILMAQLLVRNLDDSVKAALADRAALHGTSMEAEARDILSRALLRSPTKTKGLGSRIHARFAKLDMPVLESLPSSNLQPVEIPE
jgi:antitoxin FitA